MKHYIEPEIEVIRFEVTDILTVSDNNFPVIPISAPDEDNLGLTSLD